MHWSYWLWFQSTVTPNFCLQYQKFLDHPSFSWILSRNLKWLNFAPRIAGLITGGPTFIAAIEISIQLNFWANYALILEKPEFLRAFLEGNLPFYRCSSSIFQHDLPPVWQLDFAQPMAPQTVLKRLRKNMGNTKPQRQMLTGSANGHW